ncbi:MAG TPA: hypothetical protein VGQ36_22965 [Thermoanaerobaculia bacterium]|nr:hypothetical protein [Thermoanaerobaculia bacterium]
MSRPLTRAGRYSRWFCLVATVMLFALVWRYLDQEPWLRIAQSGVLLFWLWRVFSLTGSLTERFDKSAGASLHMGYIRTYLIFNILVLIGLGDRVAAVLEW